MSALPPDLRSWRGVRRGRAIALRFDGQAVPAFEGETLAAALLAAGLRPQRLGGAPGGLFCAMGICGECVVLVEGRPVEACRTAARDGMVAASPGGSGAP